MTWSKYKMLTSLYLSKFFNLSNTSLFPQANEKYSFICIIKAQRAVPRVLQLCLPECKTFAVGDCQGASNFFQDCMYIYALHTSFFSGPNLAPFDRNDVHICKPTR